MGSLRFGILYILSLIISNIPTILKHKHDVWYHSLGASGAISAVVFSAIMFNPMSKMMIFPIPIGIPAVLFGFIYLGYCYFMAKQSRDGINHDAHFFGAIAGIILTLLMVPGILPYFLSSVMAAIGR